MDIIDLTSDDDTDIEDIVITKKRKQPNGTQHVCKKIKSNSAIRDSSVSTGSHSIATSLKNKGYAVYRTSLCPSDVRTEIDSALEEFQEYVDGVQRYPLGGFGAFGNPSSFHNMVVRNTRRKVFEQLEGTFKHMAPDNTYKKELLVDRLAIRVKGTSTSGESWHRDESPTADDDDIIFGGWVNLDDKEQIFSCNAGTHRDVAGNKGFALIKDTVQIEECNKCRVHVVIPPGHGVIFVQNIIHEVASTKVKSNSYRLFVGARLTKSDNPLIATIGQELDDQAACTIKSGQVPPMWAKLHWTNWVDKLEKYSTNFKQSCREKVQVASGKNKGRVVDRVFRNIPSLKTLGLVMYPTYEESEKALYFPHK